MPQKHIVVTVTNDLHQDQRMQRICNSLAENGYRVTLVGRFMLDSYQIENELFEVHRFKLWFNKGFLFYLNYQLALAWYLLRSQWDAVYSVDLDTLGAGWLAKTIERKIQVFDAHEYFTEVPELQGKPLKKWIWGRVAKLIPTVDLAITVNDSLATIFRKQHGIDFLTIRSLPIAKKLQQRVRKRAVIYQGAVNVGRGLFQAVEALALLDDPPQLWIVGKGDVLDNLKRFVKEKDMEDYVVFYGFVDPSDLHDLTQQARVGLNLVDTALSESYRLSLTNKFFDYLQAGVPSINTRTPECETILNQHKVGVMIDGVEVQQLANVTRRLFADEEFYDLLQKNCLGERRLYTWEIESNKLVSAVHLLFDS